MDQLVNHGIDTDLVLTGFTKLDPLFHGNDEPFNDLKNSLRLDPNKKTILFAPTFYPSSIEKFGMKLGEYTMDYNVILKPHMWTYFIDEFSEYNLKPQRKLVYNLSEKFDHIAAVTNFIVTPHLGGSAEEAILAMGRAAIRGLDENRVPKKGVFPKGY